jgi:hypothetical protein
MRICYLDCHEAGLCCYLVTQIENLLHPLQLFDFHLCLFYSYYRYSYAGWEIRIVTRDFCLHEMWRRADGFRIGACEISFCSDVRTGSEMQTGNRRRTKTFSSCCMHFNGPLKLPVDSTLHPRPREGSCYKFARSGAGLLMRGWRPPSWCKQIFLLLDYAPRLFPVGYIFERSRGKGWRKTRKGWIREVWE